MRRTLLLVLVTGLLSTSCVPPSEDLAGSVPYLDAPARVTTTSSDVVPVESDACMESGAPGWDGVPPDWFLYVGELGVMADGRLVMPSLVGIAVFDPPSSWESLDLTGLPRGTPDDDVRARTVESVTVGPDGSLWAAGYASSSVDDVEFGGTINDWTGTRVLEWVARYDCVDGVCSWAPYTANEHEELIGGVGDLAVTADGTVFASVGSDRLVTFDGTTWQSYSVPGASGTTWPWSASLAVDDNGVLFAAVNGHVESVEGVLSFDGESWTWLSDPSRAWKRDDWVHQVEVGADGSLWASTDRLYADIEDARPDDTTGVLRYDGTSWTVYSIDDGLLSNDARIAAGADGTVWAIHGEFRPTGFSRFDGSTWTAYPSDRLIGGDPAAVTPDGTLWWVEAEGRLMSFDGITETSYRLPFGRFRFGCDDLCDWVSAGDVAGFVEDAYGWSATAIEVSPVAEEWDCRWRLTASDGAEGEVSVREPVWEAFGGGPFDLASHMTEGVVDFADLYEGFLPIGSSVTGHPALGEGVVVYNAGFGQFAFGVPPLDRYLQLWVEIPDDEVRVWQASEFFTVANHFLTALGWLPGS